MIKYSVIIPIYNMEKYLEECLLSIVRQNRNDVELILINDGSTDNSINICKKYSKLYNYIEIINKNNTGTTDTIIQGINKAKGLYTCFVDADDFIDNDFFEILDNYCSISIDIILFNHIKYYKNNEKKIKQNSINYGIIDNLTLNDIKFDYFDNYDKYSLYRWDKVIKTSILKTSITKIDTFPTYLEDHIISLLNLLEAKKIVYIDKYLYYYRVRSNSVSHTVNEKIFDDWKTVFFKIKEICNIFNYKKEAIDSMNRYFKYQYCRYSLKSNKKHREVKINIIDIIKIKGKDKKIVLLLYKLNMNLLYKYITKYKKRKEEQDVKEIFD